MAALYCNRKDPANKLCSVAYRFPNKNSYDASGYVWEIVRHPVQGTPIKIKQYATCETENVIYLLKCPCGKGYVGQTSRSIKTRIKEHRGNIRNYKQGSPTDTTVSRHFNLANHNQTQLKWMVLEVIQTPQRGGDMKQYLSQRETFWIKRLDTLQPLGMNDSCSVKCYL
ncbi:hypothetical protein XELAEV_18025307mg [Xenopus laevis]|uniref:GIY-YIG domain-containing protein n=1 Tax=Xenopus laevis TaxID=8355 RepID=A0A974HM80_XENLA|nr:hypothetical protein XELAEV_18025307mg [Xenopus laevis]